MVRDAGEGGKVARRSVRQGPEADRGQGAGGGDLARVAGDGTPVIGDEDRAGSRPSTPRDRSLSAAGAVAAANADSFRSDMGALDIRSNEFWNLSQVDAELRCVYDICSGCRRCLPLCPSFKVLFERLDVDAVDGDVEK